jgi:hypothetical protein
MKGIITIMDFKRYGSVEINKNNPILRNIFVAHPAVKKYKSDFFGNLYKSKISNNNIIDKSIFKLLRLKLNSMFETKKPTRKVDLLKKIQYTIIAKIGRKL